jgi:hypothetical protein
MLEGGMDETAPVRSQSDKFKEAARALGCDDDPERFRQRVGKLVKHKPVTINDDERLEADADAMGAKAIRSEPVEKQ